MNNHDNGSLVLIGGKLYQVVDGEPELFSAKVDVGHELVKIFDVEVGDVVLLPLVVGMPMGGQEILAEAPGASVQILGRTMIFPIRPERITEEVKVGVNPDTIEVFETKSSGVADISLLGYKGFFNYLDSVATYEVLNKLDLGFIFTQYDKMAVIPYIKHIVMGSAQSLILYSDSPSMNGEMLVDSGLFDKFVSETLEEKDRLNAMRIPKVKLGTYNKFLIRRAL